jgi:hypothetical protein
MSKHYNGGIMRIVRYEADGKKPKYGWLLGDKVGEIGGSDSAQLGFGNLFPRAMTLHADESILWKSRLRPDQAQFLATQFGHPDPAGRFARHPGDHPHLRPCGSTRHRLVRARAAGRSRNGAPLRGAEL